MLYLGEWFRLQPSTPVDGCERYVSTSTNGLALIEIMGERQNIVGATLIIGLPRAEPEAIAVNAGMLLRFLKNTMPEWKGCKDWVLQEITRQADSGSNKAETVRGYKRVTVLMITLGMYSVTVSHKDDDA